MADYIVKRGDTLWGIATSYKSKISGSTITAKIDTLVKVNGIKDKNKIYVGQKINFSSKSSSSSSTKKSSKNKPTIAGIGLSSTDTKGRTVFVTWNHDSKEYEDTKNYKYEWHYYNKDTKRWTDASHGETESYGSRYRFSECTPPDTATKVRFRVKPISKTKKVKSGNTTTEKPIWTNGEWSEYGEYNFADNPPLAPDAPNLKWHSDDISNDYLTFDIEIDPIGVNEIDSTKNKYGAKYINFEIFKNNSKVNTISKVAIKENGKSNFRVSTKYTGDPSGEYKVRAQSVASNNKTSGWSEFSNVLYTKPAAPKKITKCIGKRVVTNAAQGVISVFAHVEWERVEKADSYTVEYTTAKENFNPGMAEPVISSVSVQTTSADIKLYDVGDQASGNSYYFRVKAVRDEADKESDPSPVASLIAGEAPGAPTAWSSAKSAFVGEPLVLNWTHSTKDATLQTRAEVKLRVFSGDALDCTDIFLTGENITYPTDNEEEELPAGVYGTFYSYKGTLRFSIDTNFDIFKDKRIEWCVRTAGVATDDNGNPLYGEYSTPGTVHIYRKPELSLSLTTDLAGTEMFGDVTIPPATYCYSVEYDSDSDEYSIVTDSDGDFVPAENSGGSIVENVTINNMPVYQASDGTYYCVDTSGEETVITNVLQQFPFYIRAQVDGENNGIQKPIGYHVRVVSNNYYETVDGTGKNKIVSSGDEVYAKYFNAIEANTSDLVFDPLIIEMSADNIDLEPLISYTVYCDVDMSSGLSIDSNTEFNVCWEDAEYSLDADIAVDLNTYTTTILPMCKDHTGNLIEKVTMSVYRREYDGQFTELATGIPNNGTSVSDPHPALDYARYRLIARNVETGAISFYDLPGEYIGCKSIIIQWDEQWTNYDVVEGLSSEMPLWSGSMLVLPYNVKVSDNRKRDVTRVTYAGRQYPVSYHGTAISESPNWTTTIPKDDAETIYALRRLSIWAGPVYVREPSGTGFWANVTPTFNIEGTSVTIPVTLDVTRVEGGV